MTQSLKKYRSAAQLRAGLLGWLTKAAPSAGRRLDLQMLEERILYSATPLPIDPDATDDTSAQMIDGQLDNMEAALAAAWGAKGSTADSEPLAVQPGSNSVDANLDTLNSLLQQYANPDSSDRHLNDDSDAASTLANNDTAEQLFVSGTFDTAQRHELVFIDTTAQDYEQLLADLLTQKEAGRALEIVVFDSQRDGIEQITQVLAEFDDIDAIHFVSHGTARGLKLGSTWLQLENMASYQSQFALWRDSLTEGADLLFYGCDFAAGSVGQQILHSMQLQTGADVAASLDGGPHSSNYRGYYFHRHDRRSGLDYNRLAAGAIATNGCRRQL